MCGKGQGERGNRNEATYERVDYLVYIAIQHDKLCLAGELLLLEACMDRGKWRARGTRGEGEGWGCMLSRQRQLGRREFK